MQYDKLIAQVGPDWAMLLKEFMCPDSDGKCPYDAIGNTLKEKKEAGIAFYPIGAQVFQAFKVIRPEHVRVILLGQDPYPKEGYANGLAFATNNDKMPPSLAILQDGVEADAYNGLNFERPTWPKDLHHWVEQGVMLLNSALTVEADKPASHQELWKPFTEFFIAQMQKYKRNLIWMSMGATSRELTKEVNPFNHFIYLAEHPSAAARQKREWKHNNIFTAVNLAIKMNNLGEPIKW